MKYIKTVKLVVLITVLSVSTAQAAIISTYTNRADFLAATDAISISGTLPDLGSLPQNTSVMLGGVTLNLAADSTRFAFGESTDLNPGIDLVISGNENFDAVLDAPTFSFGFDIVEPGPPNLCLPISESCPSFLSQFTLTVGSESETFTLTGFFLEFIGIVTDTPFTLVEVRESFNQNQNTNEFFGEFYADAPVPIPASIWLFGSAIGLLGWKKRSVKVQ